MNTMYVPSYLLHGERGMNGWPKTVEKDEEFKTWLVEQCRIALLHHGACYMREVYDSVKHQVKYAAPEDAEFYREQYEKLGSLWDHIDACIDRALRSVADQKWVLHDSERNKPLEFAMEKREGSSWTDKPWVVVIDKLRRPIYSASTKEKCTELMRELKHKLFRCPKCGHVVESKKA